MLSFFITVLHTNALCSSSLFLFKLSVCSGFIPLRKAFPGTPIASLFCGLPLGGIDLKVLPNISEYTHYTHRFPVISPRCQRFSLFSGCLLEEAAFISLHCILASDYGRGRLLQAFPLFSQDFIQIERVLHLIVRRDRGKLLHQENDLIWRRKDLFQTRISKNYTREVVL